MMDSPEEADVVIQPATLVQVERRVGCLPERWLAVVTLKVECLPSGDVTTEAFPLVTSAGMVKERLSRMVELPVDVLQLNHAGHCVDDQMTLEQLGARVNDTLSLSLTSTHPHMFPIRIKHTTLPPLPDVITVRLRHKDGRFKKDVVVEIEKAAKRQPFLGGYRWKPTGVHFYHAATQTDYSVAPDNKVHIIRDQGSHDSQTATTGTNGTQTCRSVSCQVRRFEWNLQTRDGAISTRRSIISDVDCHKAATLIQRNWRQWKRDQSKRKSDQKAEEAAQAEEAEQKPIEALFIRFGDVTIEKTNRSLSEDAKNLRNQRHPQSDDPSSAIIAYEIELLHNTKSSASKDRLIQRLLQRVSQPKMWQSSSGALVQVETADTEKFRDIRLVYETICSATLTEHRTAALALLKKLLWGKSGANVKELIQLADRELDLLARGLMTSSLSGLQSRLRALLRHFVIDQLPEP